MKRRSEKQELFIEFRENSMHVIDAEFGLEIPLDRDSTGRLTRSAMESASARLREFFVAHGRIRPRVAICSIPARGVLLRRLSVPASEKAEVQRLLTLQLEAQLPIPPSELAWGCSPLEKNGSAMQEFVVVAVKKEILEDYTNILAIAGVAAEYAISALTRRGLCAHAPSEFAILDGSRSRSEWAAFDSRGPVSLRVLNAAPEAFNHKLYVTGEPEVIDGLVNRSASNVEYLDGDSAGNGRTAANSGLKRLIESGEEPILLGQHEPATPAQKRPQWRWIALAAGLAVLAFGLRYAEAMVYRGRLSEKSAAISRHRATLPKVEREFAFLNYIKTNQPPYLDCLTVLALSAPPGTRIDTVSIVRQGSLSLKGSVGDAQGPGAFRSKLISSGLFSRVVLEEQAPASDGQKFTFRISAQLKPDGARAPVNLPTK